MGDVTLNYALRYPFNDETITDVSTKNLADDIAAMLTNTLDADRDKSLGRASGQWSRFANQSIAANTETAIIGTSEVFDTNAEIDIAGQPTRITIVAGSTGLYWVSAGIDNIGGTAWTSGTIAIAKNGTDIVRRKYWCASGQMATDMLITGQMKLVAADILTCTILFQGTPNPSNISAARFSAQQLTT